jgi:hypothetical protein
MSILPSALFSTPKNSFKMAAVNIDSVQLYQPPFINPLFGSGKRTASPHIDPKPRVAALPKKGSKVLESAGVTARGGGNNFGLEHDSGQYDKVTDKDYLPTIEELLRPTWRKEILTQEPLNAEHADQQFFNKSSSSINIIHSQLADSLGSQGTGATPLCYKQAAS